MLARMKLDPLTNTVSFLRAELAAEITRVSRGRITSIDDVVSVCHLALDRVLALTSLPDEEIEAIHDHLAHVAAFVEHGTESASLSLRIGSTTYTANLS